MFLSKETVYNVAKVILRLISSVWLPGTHVPSASPIAMPLTGCKFDVVWLLVFFQLISKPQALTYVYP